MGVSSSPTGANGCIVVRGGPTAPEKRRQKEPARILLWWYELGERIGYLLPESRLFLAVAAIKFRSRRACFQGQQSAHAVQWCTYRCSWAVNGLALSPGSLGSAQAFQTPSRRSQCSAAAVPPGQSFAKRLEKTLRGQQRVRAKKCTRVEFKVTLCYLMTPKRMLVHSASL
jgi:hypothetical protein